MVDPVRVETGDPLMLTKPETVAHAIKGSDGTTMVCLGFEEAINTARREADRFPNVQFSVVELIERPADEPTPAPYCSCQEFAERRTCEHANRQTEPRGELRAGDYVDVGGDPGMAVYPPHVLVLWQNKRTSLVPLGAVNKTSAAPVGIGADDLTEARKLGPGGSAQNRT